MIDIEDVVSKRKRLKNISPIANIEDIFKATVSLEDRVSVLKASKKTYNAYKELATVKQKKAEPIASNSNKIVKESINHKVLNNINYDELAALSKANASGSYEGSKLRLSAKQIAAIKKVKVQTSELNNNNSTIEIKEEPKMEMKPEMPVKPIMETVVDLPVEKPTKVEEKKEEIINKKETIQEVEIALDDQKVPVPKDLSKKIEGIDSVSAEIAATRSEINAIKNQIQGNKQETTTLGMDTVEKEKQIERNKEAISAVAKYVKQIELALDSVRNAEKENRKRIEQELAASEELLKEQKAANLKATQKAEETAKQAEEMANKNIQIANLATQILGDKVETSLIQTEPTKENKAVVGFNPFALDALSTISKEEIESVGARQR
ncbi:MAG: hypothetical protein RR406_02450 [Bacilli bacterium]